MKLKLFVLAAIVALLTIGLYMPQAKAADGITPYAAVNVWTGYDMRSKELANHSDGKKDTDLVMSLPKGPTPSGLGLRGTLGKLTLIAEIGITDTIFKDKNTPAPAGVFGETLGVNKMDAKYEFNEVANIEFGRYFAPYSSAGINPFMDKANAGFMIFEGALFDTPITQVKFSYMGAYIDLIKPSSSGVTTTAAGATEKDAYDFVLPKIAVGYVGPMPFQYSAHAVYQKIKSESPNSYSITSYALAAGINAFMPWGIIHAFGFYSQNEGDMQVLDLAVMQAKSGNSASVTGTSVKNTKGFGGNAGVSYKIGNLTPGAGFGYSAFKNDDFANDQRQYTFFASLQYEVDKNVVFTPAIKYRNFGKSSSVAGAKRGTETIFGILWSAAM